MDFPPWITVKMLSPLLAFLIDVRNSSISCAITSKARRAPDRCSGVNFGSLANFSAELMFDLRAFSVMAISASY